MTHDTVSAFVLLLLVLDPFGTLPVFMSVMSSVPPRRRVWVALRESGVALAVPLLAGPSAMATVMLLASRQPAQLANWVLALVAAMAVCAVVLMASDRLNRWLGESVVSAIEKLMGLILCAVAVEMILAGLTRYFGFAT